MYTTKLCGVSQPISTAEPDDLDIRLTEELTACLKSKNLFENDQELQKRIDVLCNVTAIVKQFIRVVSKQKMTTQENEESPEYGGKLFTFGSYRLGVHNRGADIDTLCVAPRHVDRQAFFTVFYDMLNSDPEVTDLHAVEDAYVPLIKLCYNGIELDILFARLALKEVTDDQSLQDDNLLKNLDKRCVRSLNGSRVADEILNCIPKQDTFVIVLRCIKHWATVHGIYSNVLGYFGGITWAILVARVCQLYPNAAPAKLVQKFFYVFKQWQWPSPVFLKDVDTQRPNISQAMEEMVWDPRCRVEDRLHLMPIITPAYPQQNSTYNVTMSTKKLICQELEEAAIITDEIYRGVSSWEKLFEPINFFTRYKHFIVIICAAKNEKDHLNYNGFIESRLRLLVANLEQQDAVLAAQIGTRQYKPLNLDRFNIGYEDTVANLWFMGLELDAALAKSLDFTDQCNNFVRLVYNKQCEDKKGTFNEFMKLDVKYVAQKDIKYYLSKEDYLQGRRYVKKKPQLTRTLSLNSDATVSLADAKLSPSDIKREPSPMEIVADMNLNNVKKEEPDDMSLPVFSFGAENAMLEQATVKKEEPDVPIKTVLQESFNSLSHFEISSEDDLKCAPVAMKRSIDDETEAPPEKQARPNVTVA